MMKGLKVYFFCLVVAVCFFLPTGSVLTIGTNETIDGSDAISLAGRTDVTIPPASDPWNTVTFLIRHPVPAPEKILETLPPIVPVAAENTIRVLDPAEGGISFFNGFSPPLYGPGGNGLSSSNLNALDGISGHKGPQGTSTLDFTPAGLGIDFETLSPR